MLNLVQRGVSRTPFEKPENMSPVLHRLLVQRGISSQEEAARFLAPDESCLYDPYLLSDMAEAVERVRAALNKGEHICVYGDYDVDGVCATAILTGYLESVGADVESYLPSRHTEGYGLNESAVRDIAQRAQLMITVDCGISARELVTLAESLGTRMVVTDHHIPPDELPDCPVVDPQLGDYPFKTLCGAGVAFKLITALGGIDSAMTYIDLTALATVADVVPLTGENRTIVRLGLNVINTSPRPCFRALAEVTGLTGKSLTSGNIAFQLAPRLNAGGRLGSACRALDLLREKDYDAALDLAQILDEENSYRRTIEQQILSVARTQLCDYTLSEHRAIVLAGEDWNTGVMGLVASRLTEQYHYPTVLLSVADGVATGSCRSIEGVDIYQTLCACSDLLTRFGGHRRAAGLTLPAENIDALRDRIDRYIRDNCDPMCYIPHAEYDMALTFDQLEPELVYELEALQPTGFGNPLPSFLANAQVMEARAVGTNGAHLKLSLENAGITLPGIRFREGERARTLQTGGDRQILYAPRINSFFRQDELELELRILAEESNASVLQNAQRRLPSLIRKFLTHVLYNGIQPSAPGRITRDALRQILSASPQGTLIVSADLDRAQALYEEFADLPVDILAGVYQDDSRAFNTLSLYPVAGNVVGYKRVILLDLVFGQWPEDCEVFRLEDAVAPEWLNELPDVDGLRQAFVAIRNLSPRPVYAPTYRQFVELVAAGSGLSDLGALAAVKVLRNMDLLRFDHDGGSFVLARGVKCDPTKNGVFQTIQQMMNQRE